MLRFQNKLQARATAQSRWWNCFPNKIYERQGSPQGSQCSSYPRGLLISQNELWLSRCFLLLNQIFRAEHEIDVSLSIHTYCLVKIHGLEGDHFLLSIQTHAMELSGF